MCIIQRTILNVTSIDFQLKDPPSRSAYPQAFIFVQLDRRGPSPDFFYDMRGGIDGKLVLVGVESKKVGRLSIMCSMDGAHDMTHHRLLQSQVTQIVRSINADGHVDNKNAGVEDVDVDRG